MSGCQRLIRFQAMKAEDELNAWREQARNDRVGPTPGVSSVQDVGLLRSQDAGQRISERPASATRSQRYADNLIWKLHAEGTRLALCHHHVAVVPYVRFTEQRDEASLRTSAFEGVYDVDNRWSCLCNHG